MCVYNNYVLEICVPVLPTQEQGEIDSKMLCVSCIYV